jgi:hypothetical protein
LSILEAQQLSEVFLCVGHSYRAALAEAHEQAPQGTSFRFVGGRERHQAALFTWLYGKVTAVPTPAGHPFPCICGVPVTASADEVLSTARKLLQRMPPNEATSALWCVDVDGTAVPVKWLVSCITGLRVRAFHTDQARRLLTQLGFSLRRRDLAPIATSQGASNP